MDALSDLLQTSTTLWAGGAIGIAVGLIVGLLLGWLIGGRRRRRDVPAEPRHTQARNPYAGPAVRFLDAADIAHNTLLTVDQKELADTELEDALHSGQPTMRRLAESIMTLASIHNELRVHAPRPVLDDAESVFTHLTYSAMDGVSDGDAFSAAYQQRKTSLVDAVRTASGV